MDVPDPLAEPEPDAPPVAEPGALEGEELELPEPVLLPGEPIEPEAEPEPEEPLAALPLRFVWSCFALDPAPALSRLHAAMPKASAAAVRAAVSVFSIGVISWVVRTTPT